MRRSLSLRWLFLRLPIALMLTLGLLLVPIECSPGADASETTASATETQPEPPGSYPALNPDGSCTASESAATADLGGAPVLALALPGLLFGLTELAPSDSTTGALTIPPASPLLGPEPPPP